MRNPYVVLGVPFGSSSDSASAAFARRARGLRRKPDGQERLRNLTWALNQVQEVLHQPHLALNIYRVPADPGALEPDGCGVLRPAPERMARGIASEGHVERLIRAAADDALCALREDIARLATLPPR
jgi:hypothetical protein